MKADTKQLIFPSFKTALLYSFWFQVEKYLNKHPLIFTVFQGSFSKQNGTLNFNAFSSKKVVQHHPSLTVGFCFLASVLQCMELNRDAELSGLLYRLQCSRVNSINLSNMRDNRFCSIWGISNKLTWTKLFWSVHCYIFSVKYSFSTVVSLLMLWISLEKLQSA